MRYFILFAIWISTALGADFTTYIGDQFPYSISALATDGAGNTYVAGSRSIQIPGDANPQSDVFVSKVDPTGHIVFTTTFGGKDSDQGNAIAVDSAGNIWVGGTTYSDNFPLHDALLESSTGHGFLVRLAPDGTIVYSSYFYGSVNGLATDAAGNVYLTGTTDFEGFPTTAGLPTGDVNNSGVYTTSGALVTKLDPTGSKILYSAAIVGNHPDCSGGSSCFEADRITSGAAIALDLAGDAFIIGFTNTTDLPVTAGGLAGYGGFAAKINAPGNQLVYLTYLSQGGPIPPPSQSTSPTAIAADAAGNAYLTGYTNDPAFSTTPDAFQTKLSATAPFTNAFAIELNPKGATVWATFLGGQGPDQANVIALDHSGNLWLTGTNAANFPSTSPFFTLDRGDFLAELSPDGSKLLSSMELPTVGQALAIDPAGVLHAATETGLVSTVTPGQTPAPRITGIVNAAQGQISGRIAPGEVISIFGYGIGPATAVSAAPQNGTFPTSLGGIQVLVNDVAIPLIYVSTYQINAEIPSSIVGGEASMQIAGAATQLPEFRISVDSSIFGIFTNPDGSAKAINQDGTLNSQSNPAKAGSIVSIWGTGFGNIGAPPATGAISTIADNWCPYCQVDGQTVQYAGSAPGLIDGVMQINFVALGEEGGSGASQSYFNFSLGGSAFVWVE